MKKNFYITTPLYYPSAKLHIGHAYCSVTTDCLARYKRMIGHEVFFLTGSDEHGLKIETNAKNAGVEPLEFTTNIVEGFKDLWKLLDLSHDTFVRTTNKNHEVAVQQIFTRLLNQGDIYLDKYEGWYCKDCEAFWTDTQVGEEIKCPDCNRSVQKATEESYFFKVDKYLERLLKYYDEHLDFLTPTYRKNEMINTFIKPGLTDLCVSRTSFTWGIQVRENPKHVIYVWFDALISYITGLGYLSEDDSNFKKYWNKESEKVHILGADINRFHSIYWPMFLMALDLPLPDKEFIHGLLMMKDEKMSKSKGNVVSAIPLIERYGADTVRYYLCRETYFGSDGKFTPELFVERTNVDLANGFGNLLNRTISMIEKYFGGIVPLYKGNVTEFDEDLVSFYKNTFKKYESSMEKLLLTDALEAVNELVDKTNKYIDLTSPWALAKEEESKPKLESVMCHLANSIFGIAMMYSPVLTKASYLTFKQLGIDKNIIDYEMAKEFGKVEGCKVIKEQALFPRLDAKIETEEIRKHM